MKTIQREKRAKERKRTEMCEQTAKIPKSFDVEREPEGGPRKTLKD